MKWRTYLSIVLFFVPYLLFAKEIATFYGPIVVDEPVLLELIEHPVFQRLKQIRTYGVSYYTEFNEEFTRFDHSVGVFVVLRTHGASLKEQIAGLLHDVSHTAFSHVGDWIFKQENKDDGYQDLIHAKFLEQSGLAQILRNYGYAVEEIIPEEETFPALECSLPNLCADRIDYNIQGAYHQGFITLDEAKEVLADLQFIEGRWVASQPELIKKVARFSLFMTLNCWGSLENYLTSRWLADAILRGIELNILTYQDIHFGTDQAIWDLLHRQNDAFIADRMMKIANASAYYVHTNAEEADYRIFSKNRGINPLIQVDSGTIRLTDLDPEYAKEFEILKSNLIKGWFVKIIYTQAT